jgi:hypothetical protein
MLRARRRSVLTKLRTIPSHPGNDLHTAVQAFNGFLAKTDGRDKLCATIQVRHMFRRATLAAPSALSTACRLMQIVACTATSDVWAASLHDYMVLVSTRACAQYVLMFLANGEPGNVRKAMASVAAARKVFRVFRVSLQCASLLHPLSTAHVASTTFSLCNRPAGSQISRLVMR